MDKIVIVGFGGHAKSVADCIEREGRFHIVGYTDIREQVSSYKYLGTDSVLPSLFENGIKYAAVGIGYMGRGSLRKGIYAELKSIGFEFPIIKDPSSIISDTVQIGEGTFIGKGAIVNAEASIGKMVIVNTKALIEHECVIGDFVHIAVGAVLCGQVKVGEAAFVGANATVIQCQKIKPQMLVPAGTIIR